MEDKLKFSNLITEADLCNLLGVNKLALGRLRNEEGLPYLKVNQNSRVYLECDVMDWLTSRRVSKTRSQSTQNLDAD